MDKKVNQKLIFRCNYCNKNYASSSSLCNHNKKFHNEHVVERGSFVQNNEVVCGTFEVLDKKLFKLPQCKFCNKQFNDRSNKSKHEKICKNKIILEITNVKNEIRYFTHLKYIYENKGNCDETKIMTISKIIIKLFKKKRHLIQEIILLKSAFSIIDQMFHKEVKDGESKRNKNLYSLIFGENIKNPEEMNNFIKNLMDPFNNSIVSINNDSYYDEYYELYGIGPAS